jgi:hypothetical protein
MPRASPVDSSRQSAPPPSVSEHRISSSPSDECAIPLRLRRWPRDCLHRLLHLGLPCCCAVGTCRPPAAYVPPDPVSGAILHTPSFSRRQLVSSSTLSVSARLHCRWDPEAAGSPDLRAPCSPVAGQARCTGDTSLDATTYRQEQAIFVDDPALLRRSPAKHAAQGTHPLMPLPPGTSHLRRRPCVAPLASSPSVLSPSPTGDARWAPTASLCSSLRLRSRLPERVRWRERECDWGERERMTSGLGEVLLILFADWIATLAPRVQT